MSISKILVKNKQSTPQWRSVITTTVLKKLDFDYEIIDYQLV